MLQIKPRHALSDDEIRAEAATAADNGERLAAANPYPHGGKHDIFALAYLERERELQGQLLPA